MLFCSVSIFAQSNNLYETKDYFMMTRISNPKYSPDGNWILYTQSQKENWESSSNSDLYLISRDNKTKFQLTTSPQSEWSAEWSPNGKWIGFMSNREGAPQVFLISPDGGEARKITNIKEGVSAFHWAGNSRIAFTANEERDSAIIAAEKNAGGGWVVGTKYITSALWLKPLFESEAQKITDGSFYIIDFNSSPKGNLFELIVSDDSELFKQMTDPKVLVIDSDGNEKFNFKGIAGISMPEFSPDENKIAFVGNTIGFSANDGLFISNLNTGRTVNITYDFDPTIEKIMWLDENTISFQTPRNVTTGIYSISLSDVSLQDAVNDVYINAEVDKVETLLKPDWVVYDYSVNADKEIIFTASRSNKPVELYSSSGGIKKLTNENDWLANKELANTKVINFKSADGTEIEAIITLPLGYEAGNKYPVLVLPHGGPDGIIKDQFGLFGQTFAREGFIVYEPNFRGSIGYGRKFYEANRGKLGYVDYDDIMSGLKYLISEGYVDENKMVVGGWSYGGYMTDWIIGHTDIFKAAVAVAGISNTVSMYAQSDINHGIIAEWEFRGVPVKNMENFTRSSPLEYLKNCTTPTLILHGEADDRVPVMQGWEIYRALVDMNIEVKMVLYPDANHGIRAPKQFVNVFDRWVNWYKEHLN